MASASPPPPRVGVAALILDTSDRVLTGKRKGSHGAGTWQLPGGHLEQGEDVLACAQRETKEETGLDVKGSRIVAVTNDVFEGDAKHYITLFVLCRMEDPQAVPEVMEPDKCDGWLWKTWTELGDIMTAAKPTEELFLPLRHLLEQTKGLDELQRRL